MFHQHAGFAQPQQQQQQQQQQLFTTTPPQAQPYAPQPRQDNLSGAGILGHHPQHQHSYAQPQQATLYAPAPLNQLQYVTLPHDGASQQHMINQPNPTTMAPSPQYTTLAVHDHRSQFAPAPTFTPGNTGGGFIAQGPQVVPINVNYTSVSQQQPQPQPQHMHPVYIMSGQQPQQPEPQRVPTPSLHSSGGVQYVFLPAGSSSPHHQAVSMLASPSHSSPSQHLESVHISSPQPQAMWQPANAFIHQQPNQGQGFNGVAATGPSHLMMVPQQMPVASNMPSAQPSMMTFSQYHIPTHTQSPFVPIGRGSVSSMSLDWNSATPRYSIDSVHGGAPTALAARKQSSAAPILGPHTMPHNGPAGASASSSGTKVGIVCRHFIEGKCNRRKCRFVHDATVASSDATVSHVDENDLEDDDEHHPAHHTTCASTRHLPAGEQLDSEHTVPIDSISEH